MTLSIACTAVLGTIALVQTLRLWAYQRTLRPIVAGLEAMVLATKTNDTQEFMRALATMAEAVGMRSPDAKTPPG